MKQLVQKFTAKTKTAKKSTAAKKVTPATLRTWNKWLAVVYALQGAAILVMSTAKTVPLTVSYLAENPLATEAAGEMVLATATRVVGDVNLVYLIAAVLFLSALIHASAAWWWRAKYERELKSKVHRFRWFAAIPVLSLLFIILALLVGVTNLAVLGLFAALSALTMMLALVYERSRQENGRSARLLRTMVLIAVFTPLAVLALYLVGAYIYGVSTVVPAYVTSAFLSLLVLGVGALLIFHFNEQKKGAWANYFYSERGHMIVAVLAQTVLAWTVYFGALAA